MGEPEIVARRFPCNMKSPLLGPVSIANLQIRSPSTAAIGRSSLESCRRCTSWRVCGFQNSMRVNRSISTPSRFSVYSTRESKTRAALRLQQDSLPSFMCTPRRRLNSLAFLCSITLVATFYRFEEERGPNDIENLWEAFEAALAYADSEDDVEKARFAAAYDAIAA